MCIRDSFCGIAAHQELAQREAAGEDLGDQIVQPGVVEAEDDGAEVVSEDAADAGARLQDEQGAAEAAVAVSEEGEPSA